jgi:hypothetical protein
MAIRSEVTGTRISDTLLMEKMRLGLSNQTLAGTLTMDEDLPPLLALDPGGAGRTVLLPPEAAGLFFVIINTADAAETLTVKEDANVTTIGTVEQDTIGLFFCGKNGAGTLTWYDLTIFAEAFLDGVTAGTVTASKAVVVDASKDITTFRNVGISGQIQDANGNEQIKFVTTASAVNELTTTNAATGSGPELSATGGDTNIDIRLLAKGTGAFQVDNGTDPVLLRVMGAAGGFNSSIVDLNSNEIFDLQGVTSAVNQLAVKNAATGAGPELSARGGDTNIDINLLPKGVGKFGYPTGAGGAVTQITNRTTGVTLNKATGQITTNNASLAAEAAAEFVVTNSAVAIGDVVVVSIQSGTNGGNTDVYVSAVAAGSFNIKVSNDNAAGGTAETGAIIINFAVIKAVAA